MFYTLSSFIYFPSILIPNSTCRNRQPTAVTVPRISAKITLKYRHLFVQGYHHLRFRFTIMYNCNSRQTCTLGTFGTEHHVTFVVLHHWQGRGWTVLPYAIMVSYMNFPQNWFLVKFDSHFRAVGFSFWTTKWNKIMLQQLNHAFR